MSKSTVLKPESTPDALGGVAKGQGWSSCSDYVGLGGTAKNVLPSPATAAGPQTHTENHCPRRPRSLFPPSRAL